MSVICINGTTKCKKKKILHISGFHAGYFIFTHQVHVGYLDGEGDGSRRIFSYYIGECGSTLYSWLAHAVPPTNTKLKPLLLPTRTYTNTHKRRTSHFKSTVTFLGPAKLWKCLSAAPQKPEILSISSSSISSESTVALSMQGWHRRFHPLIQNSSRYFSRHKRVCHTQTLTSTEHHISSIHLHFWVQLSYGRAFPQPNKNRKFLRFLHHQCHQRVL